MVAELEIRPAEQEAGPAPAKKPRAPRRPRAKAAPVELPATVEQSESTPPPATPEVPAPLPVNVPASFAALGLRDTTLAAIIAAGWTTPTPIQAEAVTPLLQGQDVVGRARTGTGKTGAFGLPLIEKIDPSAPYVQAIVLVPTRELAVQVSAELTRLGKNSGLRIVAVYGGQKIQTQLSALARGAHIVVGTPGRVQDHMQRGTLRLDRVRVAVLDEADEMLDIGFADDMERILRRTPKDRQTALFSATLPPFIRRMIIRYMRDPVWVNVIDPDAAPTVETVDQVMYVVSDRDKVEAFVEVYNDIDEDPRVLVFRRTQIGVDRLASALRRRGGSAAGLHGGMRQGERDRTLAAFKDGDIDVLIATNVAARGLDIPDVTHVVNFDIPQNAEEYIHRIGRTARAGKRGTAVTFVGEWDIDPFAAICKEIGIEPRHGELALYQHRHRQSGD